MSSINLTIDEIKQHLNVDHDLDDGLIESYKQPLKYAKSI